MYMLHTCISCAGKPGKPEFVTSVDVYIYNSIAQSTVKWKKSHIEPYRRAIYSGILY